MTFEQRMQRYADGILNYKAPNFFHPFDNAKDYKAWIDKLADSPKEEQLRAVEMYGSLPNAEDKE